VSIHHLSFRAFDLLLVVKGLHQAQLYLYQGRISPIIIFSSVVFPLPFGPTIPIRSPLVIFIEKSSKIFLSPNDFVMPD
jgi:hypothetical protein